MSYFVRDIQCKPCLITDFKIDCPRFLNGKNLKPGSKLLRRADSPREASKSRNYEYLYQLSYLEQFVGDNMASWLVRRTPDWAVWT